MANQHKSFSDLPINLLQEISNNLKTHKDLSSFRLVCSHWRSSTPIKPCLPWLVVSVIESDLSFLECHHPSAKVKHKKFRRWRHYFPQEIYDFFCSYKGWLLTSRFQGTLAMSIYNPATGYVISLAGTERVLKIVSIKPGAIDGELKLIMNRSLDWPLSPCLHNLVLSDKDNLVAMAILRYRDSWSLPAPKLIFYRGGDETWTVVNECLGCSSLACVDGRFFYALGEEWRLYVLDFGPPMKLQILLMRPPPVGMPLTTDNCHLVDCCGDLLLIWHGIDLNVMKNYVFKVFKGVDLQGVEPKWVIVEDLGDRAIFIGCYNSSAFSIEAASEYLECKRNYIYFCGMLVTAYHEEKSEWLGGTSGEFDLENGRITFFSNRYVDYTGWFLPSAVVKSSSYTNQICHTQKFLRSKRGFRHHCPIYKRRRR